MFIYTLRIDQNVIQSVTSSTYMATITREIDEYCWQLFIEMMVIHSGMAQWTKTPTAVPRSGFEPRPSEI